MLQVDAIVITAAASAGTGIVGKIVWDWLKNRSGGYLPSGPGRKCADHETCIISLERLKSSDIVQTEQLNKGNDRMNKMAADIGEIKTGVAVLVSRINLRPGNQSEKG